MKKLIILIAALTTGIVTAQDKFPETQKELEIKIIALDSLAFEAYNTCDLEKSRTFFTDDVEFYHDKGGISKGCDKLMENMRKHICNGSQKILRKPILSTFEVYPMFGYGAILSGDHEFYIVENGVERKTGTAKFTHLWILENGKWKMSRILSYEHKPAE
ncbi:nuclear transport factor 2 family protein [Flavobacterium beibuense]|uniref:DUF4440 domain-containing protein n=1 Tax=Flavobacterium beibuense F44-8 TaxID=1406840 RepID=A0A0A2M7W9_9FLAO|nr:nuclear transport factor 2 family protein [Flavobacterium beibuense]KGO84395.1 hypothetical protein Q763_01225 [Flavobacterium beibuense F44-8]